MNTAITQQQPIPAWKQIFRDTSAVYTLDRHSASMKDVPTWTMHSPNELPLTTEEYYLDTGESNPAMFAAMIDLGKEVMRILPTARLRIAPVVMLPIGGNRGVTQKALAVTEYDLRPGRYGEFEVPTLLLSTNQSVEDAYREAYRFLWMLIEEQIPKIHGIDPSTMSRIERTSKDSVDPIMRDWLSKFPKLPGESQNEFVARVAQERRAMTFTNMAMNRICGCWDDTPDRDDEAIDRLRMPHDMMFRFALRGTLGEMIRDQYGPAE